ncbi:MAG TPA: VCBS repeat-containing protein [Candidatus Binatia bacterium]|nr:VCBS repeat-containing protein [Candidatus Binatia bacterium]
MLRPQLLLSRSVHALVIFCSFSVFAVPLHAQFETRASQQLPAESFAAATGDLNRDGNLDVAVVGDDLSIFMGNGDGTFQPPQNYTGPFYAIAVADFNNDGIPDLVVAPYSDSVMVFLGNGDGTFQSPKSSPTTGPAGVIVVGDFNGDHKLDIASQIRCKPGFTSRPAGARHGG